MKAVISVILLASLAACQVVPPVKEPVARPMSLIEGYAKSASDSLRSLAEIERATRKSKAQKRTAIVDRITGADELYHVLDFGYNGQLDQAVEALMKSSPGMSGWVLSIPDAKPMAPVIISVNGRDRTILDYLEDLGAQVGARAVISVDPANKTIHIVYGIREIRN